MLKVLVVDDETVVRRGIVLGVDWASIGCVVVGEAANGEEGLLAAERYSPNLVITDIRMPKLDGIEMLRELRRRGAARTPSYSRRTATLSTPAPRSSSTRTTICSSPFRITSLSSPSSASGRRSRSRGELSVIDTLALEKGDKSRYVLKALEYISEHYADGGINITEIAQHLGVSEGHLSHVFKKETNYTVVGYLTRYRIHMALKLLRDCRYKIYEVADMVGYKDVTYFGSTFKKLTGLSPSEYQDRCR